MTAMAESFDAREFGDAAVRSVAAAVPEADLDALRVSFDLIRASTRHGETPSFQLPRHLHR